MKIQTENKLWIGLFSHIDSIAKGSLDLLLKLKGMGIKELGGEYLVDESKFRTIKKIVNISEERVGGNAANASFFLGSLGIENTLSAPIRPKKLMDFFRELPVNFAGVRKKTAENASKDDPCYEHLVIEVNKPLSEGDRIVISWDPMTREGLLDQAFWQSMDSGVLLLSGIHLIEKKERIDEIIERIKKKDIKVYFELGEPTPLLKYGINKLLEEDLVWHMGMNERECLKIFGRSPLEIQGLSKEIGCGITVHSPDFVFSTHAPMLRGIIDIVQAWAVGDLSYYPQVLTLPLKRTEKDLVPTRALPYISILTGLGDAFSGLDAMRLFNPQQTDQLIRSMAFRTADKFPANL